MIGSARTVKKLTGPGKREPRPADACGPGLAGPAAGPGPGCTMSVWAPKSASAPAIFIIKARSHFADSQPRAVPRAPEGGPGPSSGPRIDLSPGGYLKTGLGSSENELAHRDWH
eukprot:563387-Hanusia_phi.AAC.1